MITAKDWALSLNAQGIPVIGADDIIQCINIIFTTQKGSDPFRPDFGIDIESWIDVPVNIAAPGIVAEMIKGLIYETRVTVTAIVTKIEYNKITFNIQGDVVNNKRQKIKIQFVLISETGELLLTEQSNPTII